MDRFLALGAFAKVVEQGSFARAADRLGISTSAVSRHVADLEAHLGARLLHRTTRKVTPTHDGAAFYERALRVADVEEAESLVGHAAADPSGRLRVDVPGRIGRLIIAPALPAFLGRYPQIEIDLGVTDRAVNLIEDSTD